METTAMEMVTEKAMDVVENTAAVAETALDATEVVVDNISDKAIEQIVKTNSKGTLKKVVIGLAVVGAGVLVVRHINKKRAAKALEETDVLNDDDVFEETEGEN